MGYLVPAGAPTSLRQVLKQVEKAYLRPRAAAVRDAKEKADRLVSELHAGRGWMFDVVKVHDHGSLSRGTGLRDFNDLDRLVQLDPHSLRTQQGAERSARDTIQRMAKHIRDRRLGLVVRGYMKVRAQEHSVGIEYPANGLRIDLVPAVLRRRRLCIPERGTGEWIVTDPARTAQRLRQARKIQPDCLIAIRLLKGWARARGWNAPIPSFGIETLVVNGALSSPLPVEGTISSFFADIGEAHKNRRLVLGDAPGPQGAVTLIEPVSGNDLTAQLDSTQRQRLIGACRTASEALGRISDQVSRGRSSAALTAARRLFVGDRR